MGKSLRAPLGDHELVYYETNRPTTHTETLHNKFASFRSSRLPEKESSENH